MVARSLWMDIPPAFVRIILDCGGLQASFDPSFINRTASSVG